MVKHDTPILDRQRPFFGCLPQRKKNRLSYFIKLCPKKHKETASEPRDNAPSPWDYNNHEIIKDGFRNIMVSPQNIQLYDNKKENAISIPWKYFE